MRQARRQLILRQLILGPSHGEGKEAGFGWKDISGFLLMLMALLLMPIPGGIGGRVQLATAGPRAVGGNRSRVHQVLIASKG